jgi:hypothetical protein
VVGHLVCLWTWAVDASPDGVLDLSKPRVIARAAKWELDPGRFVDALLAVRFLDPDGAIHDWDDYTGKLMERRERTNAQTKERMREYRDRKRLRLGGEAQPVTRDVTRNKRNRYAPVTPGYAPTVPNPTVPNRTRPTPTTPVERVAPAAPDAPPDAIVPAAISIGRKRDLVFEAIQEVFPQGPRTQTERSRWNKAAQELRDGGVSPDEIREAARNWANVMSDATMTPMGIASNLGLLLGGPQVNGRSKGTTVGLHHQATQRAALRPSPEDELAEARRGR